MRIIAAFPAGANLFPATLYNPRINDPLPSSPPPLPVPIRKSRRPPRSPSSSPYITPSKTPSITSSPDASRSVIVGDSGLSFLLPGAPFEFQFSYSETPKDKPLTIRSPSFLPFAPPDKSRPWTGKTRRLSKKMKRKLKRKTKIRLIQPFSKDPSITTLQMSGRQPIDLGMLADVRSREDVLGEPLTHAESVELVAPHLSSNRQVNLGRDGVTHNMLDLIHCQWKRREVCKVRCLGVPTIDMNNVCYHLEEKTCGKVIYRIGGVVYLFRGRNYNPQTRPRYPVMLWKPTVPVYPKLIQEVPDGLTKKEVEELRRKGRDLQPICKLAKNGKYFTLVKDVRNAFELSTLVKIDCQGFRSSDHKRIGVKLKDLVPCVLLSFDDEQILMWRGKDWKSRYHKPLSLVPKISAKGVGTSSSSLEKDIEDDSSCSSGIVKVMCCPKIKTLWNQALESSKAFLLNETDLITPDSLLKKVEEFEGIPQAIEESDINS